MFKKRDDFIHANGHHVNILTNAVVIFIISRVFVGEKLSIFDILNGLHFGTRNAINIRR